MYHFKSNVIAAIAAAALTTAAFSTAAWAETKWDMPVPYGDTNFHTQNIAVTN